MYAIMDNQTGIISISYYSVDDPMWENNHMDITEYGRGQVNKHESVKNILTNVMQQIGVYVTWEN
jgi:hypothetical protein